MPTILVQNSNTSPLGLQIEPWAIYERIAPGSRAEVTFDELGDTLEFTINEDGDAFIGIDSDITLSIDGRTVFSAKKP